VTALVAVLATLLTIAVVVLVGLAVAAARRDLTRRADEQVDRDRLVASLYLERVVVTLHSGEGFTGLLADQDAESLLLRSAQALPAGRDVDGELLIPRRDVHYLQKP
jgi:hypothetical protein